MNYKYIFHTPFGYAALLYSIDPFNITEIFLPSPDKGYILKKTHGIGAEKNLSNAKVSLVAEAVQNYFKGKKEPFPPLFFDWIDFGNITSLEKEVLFATTSISYGKTASYGDIARFLGRPKAYRFVGNTLAKNPFPVLIPCHRIIRRDGSTGGFGGGMELKVKMLALEKR
jgi:methylated-DNA-[protein]-cysteine S-methyltransferase